MSATPARGRNWGRWLALGSIDVVLALVLALVLAFGLASVDGAASATTPQATNGDLPYVVNHVPLTARIKLTSLIAGDVQTTEMRSLANQIETAISGQSRDANVAVAVIVVDCGACGPSDADAALKAGRVVSHALKSFSETAGIFATTQFQFQADRVLQGNVRVDLYILTPVVSTPTSPPAPTVMPPPAPTPAPTAVPSSTTVPPSPTGAAAPTATTNK